MLKIDIPNKSFEIPESDMEDIKSSMFSSVYYVVFGKKNGEKRGLLCTRSSYLTYKISNHAFEFKQENSAYSSKMKDVDTARGYVNIYDIGMRSFRKINRKTIYVLQRVCDDTIELSDLTKLVADYGVKTLENEHLFKSQPKSHKSKSDDSLDTSSAPVLEQHGSVDTHSDEFIPEVDISGLF